MDSGIKRTILFFDGNCGMCTKTVQFFLPRSSGELVFAPLFGETFNAVPASLLPNPIPDSIMTWDGINLRTKTGAIIGLKPHVNLGLKMGITLLQLFPAFLRNWGYDFVARHRNRNKETCWLISKEQAKRLLP